MSKLKVLLLQLGIDLVHVPAHKREDLVDAACEKVLEWGVKKKHDHGESSHEHIGWCFFEDFCSTAKEPKEPEKPQSNYWRGKCNRCDHCFTSSEVSLQFPDGSRQHYPNCPPQPEPKHEMETVDGILASMAEHQRLNHLPIEASARQCSICRTERQITAKRVSDALLERFRNHVNSQPAGYWTLYGIEAVILRTFGQEGK